MAKPDKPLLSLGATGTIGDSITFTRRRGVDIVEKKPIPAYRRTLAQQYQRWLYLDYIYRWHQLSTSEKQTWQTAASRYHLTGYQYYLKYMLTNLPDIAGWWKLDEKGGVGAYDSSRNANHGTIYGAIPAAGVIDGSYFFDNTDDYIDCGNPSSLNFGTGSFSCEAWIKIAQVSGTDGICAKYSSAYKGFAFHVKNGVLEGHFNGDIGAGGLAGGITVGDNIWHHVAVTFEYGVYLRLYVDGVADWAWPFPAWGSINVPDHFTIGRRSFWPEWWNGWIDNVIVYNRVLAPEEIQIHSERRYP